MMGLEHDWAKCLSEVPSCSLPSDWSTANVGTTGG